MEKWRCASLEHIYGIVVITPKNEGHVGSHGKDQPQQYQTQTSPPKLVAMTLTGSATT